MDLSVIIVNWNAANYLRKCLASLYQQIRGITFEVIVVDNASYDGCEEIILAEFPGVTFLQSGENLGFAGANNLGFSRSSGELLLFLNPDTEIIGDALVRMVACLRSNSSAGAVGARLLNTDGSLQTTSVQAFPTISNQLLDFDLLRRAFPTWRLWGMQALLRGDSEPAAVDAISGACFMVRRPVFEKVGLFSEEYFMYSDDLDLSYKIKKAGYSVLYMNGCQVVHHGGKSSAKQEEHFSDLLQRDSLARFFRQTRGSVYCGAYRAVIAGIAAIRLGLVICVAPLGGIGLQGKTPSYVFQKWSRIFGWALGFKEWLKAGTRAGHQRTSRTKL